MSELDTPAIGRKLRDPEHRRAILLATPRAEWPVLARAYLTELGCTPAEQGVILYGVLSLWQQLYNEANNAAEQPKPRSDLPQPDRAGT